MWEIEWGVGRGGSVLYSIRPWKNQVEQPTYSSFVVVVSLEEVRESWHWPCAPGNAVGRGRSWCSQQGVGSDESSGEKFSDGTSEAGCLFRPWLAADSAMLTVEE